MRNLVNILDFTTEEIDGLVRLASDIMEHPELYSESCIRKAVRVRSSVHCSSSRPPEPAFPSHRL